MKRSVSIVYCQLKREPQRHGRKVYKADALKFFSFNVYILSLPWLSVPLFAKLERRKSFSLLALMLLGNIGSWL